MIYSTFIDSPIGRVLIKGANDRISFIGIENRPKKHTGQLPGFMANCAEELKAYFYEGLEQFSFEVNLDGGSTFQKKIWTELLNIPYGKTRTYLNIAEKLYDKNYVRAVGNSVGKNPLMIYVPCHRIIGSDGSMTGFAYGIEIKKQLLALEKSKLYGAQKKLF